MFDQAAVTLTIADLANTHRIAYEDIRTLQFGGRGALTVTSRGGWVGGGFGLTGAIEGALMATALNTLSTKQTTTIESLITMEWRGGGVVLLNQTDTPQQIADRMAPVVERISEHRAECGSDEKLEASGASGDLAGQLAHLADLYRGGLLTEEEFSAAKAKLLR